MSNNNYLLKYYPLFDSDSKQRAQTLQEGRNLVMAQVIGEMDLESRQGLVELLDAIVDEVKMLDPRSRFSRGMALELVWEALLFESDPHKNDRATIFQRYEQARKEAGDGYTNPLAEW